MDLKKMKVGESIATAAMPKGWTKESVKSFWKSLTGDKTHKHTACVKKMEGKVDDPHAFCSWAASEGE